MGLLLHTMCGKFGLLPHISDDDAAVDPADDLRSQADYAVKNWIQCSIADDVFDLASDDDQNACDLWVSVRDLF